jgi:hypothetical protein
MRRSYEEINVEQLITPTDKLLAAGRARSSRRILKSITRTAPVRHVAPARHAYPELHVAVALAVVFVILSIAAR